MVDVNHEFAIAAMRTAIILRGGGEISPGLLADTLDVLAAELVEHETKAALAELRAQRAIAEWHKVREKLRELCPEGNPCATT